VIICHQQYFFQEMSTMKKAELKLLFNDYPDIVVLPELCIMMGGIGDSTARKLLRGGYIRSFKIRSTYYMPERTRMMRL